MIGRRHPPFVAFGFIEVYFAYLLVTEAVEVGMPGGAFPSVSADVGLEVVQHAETRGKVRKVHRSGRPVSALAFDHGQGFHVRQYFGGRVAADTCGPHEVGRGGGVPATFDSFVDDGSGVAKRPEYGAYGMNLPLRHVSSRASGGV